MPRCHCSPHKPCRPYGVSPNHRTQHGSTPNYAPVALETPQATTMDMSVLYFQVTLSMLGNFFCTGCAARSLAFFLQSAGNTHGTLVQKPSCHNSTRIESGMQRSSSSLWSRFPRDPLRFSSITGYCKLEELQSSWSHNATPLSQTCQRIMEVAAPQVRYKQLGVPNHSNKLREEQTDTSSLVNQTIPREVLK